MITTYPGAGGEERVVIIRKPQTDELKADQQLCYTTASLLGKGSKKIILNNVLIRLRMIESCYQVSFDGSLPSPKDI